LGLCCSWRILEGIKAFIDAAFSWFLAFNGWYCLIPIHPSSRKNVSTDSFFLLLLTFPLTPCLPHQAVPGPGPLWGATPRFEGRRISGRVFALILSRLSPSLREKHKE